jgi:hypothetical protein
MDLPFKLTQFTPIKMQVHAQRFGLFHTKRNVMTNEIVHPSVIEFETKEGSIFVMALTPYPKMDARWENPSIVFSHDGINWSERESVNPIFSSPKDAVIAGGPHNCDPNVVWCPTLKKAFLAFINWGDNCKHVRILVSEDFISWRDMGSTNIETILKNNEIRVSPSLIYSAELKQFLAFMVRADSNMKKPSFIETFASKDGLTWEKTGESYPLIKYKDSLFYPWHISVRKVGEEYWMMAAMNHGKLSFPPIHLFFLKSSDGLNWFGSENPVLEIPPSKSGEAKLYHSDFTVANGKMKLWYSIMSEDRKFSISCAMGITTVKGCKSNNFIGLE